MSTSNKEAKRAMYLQSFSSHLAYALAHVPGKAPCVLTNFNEDTFESLREYIGVNTECRSISILSASPNEKEDSRWLTHLFMEAMKVKFPNTAIIVKSLINNMKVKSSSRIPGQEGRVIMETFLSDQFRESTGFSNISECGIFAFNFVLTQSSNDVDIDKSTANPGYILDYQFTSKKGVLLSGEELTERVLNPFVGNKFEAICSVSGVAVGPPTLVTEVVGGTPYNIASPSDLNVNVLQKETVTVGRPTFRFDDGYTGLFMGLNHLNSPTGRPFCWNAQSKTLELDSLIGRTVQDAVNSINIQDRSKLRIGILTTSAKKKAEFEVGLTKALLAAKRFGMVDRNFNKEIQIYIIKPKQMTEEQSLDSYAVITGKYMSCRIDYKYLSVLMLLDAVFIEDTIYSIKSIAEPGTLYQPNSQNFIQAAKLQNGANYDAAYTQADYDNYNCVLLSRLNSVISQGQGDRSAFAQTLIAATIRTSYGTTITTVYRGFADGYVPVEPSGTNGFGWDTIMCITAFIMNDSNIVITLEDFYNYLTFEQHSNGNLDFRPTSSQIEETKIRYRIEGKTIADLDKAIVPLYKPRFFASIQFLSMIDSLTKNHPFSRDLIIKYNSLREDELRNQTTKRLAMAVNIANQMSKGNIAVENGLLVQKKQINAMDLF